MVVLVVLVALVIMNLGVFSLFCGGCGGCIGGNGSITSNYNRSTTTDLCFFLYINLQLCNLRL